MYIENSIDVIIPSFRLDEAILLPIIQLKQPEKFSIHYYIVADNPDLKIPLSLRSLADQGSINLIVNQQNLGFSATRNKGIRLGKSKWLLLLDDDIVPSADLLLAYAHAINESPEAIGLAGVTKFPLPFNAATRAMDINGTTGHFSAATSEKELMWVPTANVMLNRYKTDNSLFNDNLKKGGEDIEFLVRNCLLYKQKYIAVPDAIVTHPWWDSGRMQSGRNFRYGQGSAQIASLPTIKPYTYRDLLNPAESILFLLLFSPLVLWLFSGTLLLLLFGTILFTEFVTIYLKAIIRGRTYSLKVAWCLLMLKNTNEAGYLWMALTDGRVSGIAERIDVSFKKPHPSWFRLNKWKIVKILLTLVCLYFIFR